MALTPQQKALRELDGDEPEAIAWNLMEWIRLVELMPDRNGVLNAYAASLATAKASAAAPAAVADEPATGTQRKFAFKLLHLIAEIEGRDYGQRNQGDRAWILDCYTACLATVLGTWVEPVVAEIAPVEAAA